jgi:hypothetical protein
LVGEQTGRRPHTPDLAGDVNRERRARYCMGFEADWFLPAHLAAEWQSRYYPREPTRASVAQWLKRTEQHYLEYQGQMAQPELASEV